jgi:hypothetical protein
VEGLAIICQQQSRYKEAEQLFKQVLKGREEQRDGSGGEYF